MPPSSISRIALATVLALSGVAAGFPATAQAHSTGMPFETRFPQEIQKTTFSDTWGAARSEGRTHLGTDLMTTKMTEVYAFADGIISVIARSPRAGRYVIIDHPEDWESYYIHLNNDTPGTDDGDAPWHFTIAPGLREGSEVVAGQLIGWAGDSGNAEGSRPHTHFELRHHGANLNPYRALAEAYEVEKADLLKKLVLFEIRRHYLAVSSAHRPERQLFLPVSGRQG